jgi:uncharacterized membrane protein YeaQ/YmgE (transglycosylase-associated protein family)
MWQGATSVAETCSRLPGKTRHSTAIPVSARAMLGLGAQRRWLLMSSTALWNLADCQPQCLHWHKEIDMSLFAWIILGLISGFVASKLVNKRGEGALLDVALGIVGAFVGGWIFTASGSSGVTGLNVWSMLVSVAGAVVTLVLYHAVRRIA